MRCPYCNSLIIHKFNGRYNRLDKKRKRRHMKRCDERPDDERTLSTDTESNGGDPQ